MSPSEQVVFRDYPIWIWLTGAMVLTVAVMTAISGESFWWPIVAALIGFLIGGFASILTVTVDQNRGSLNLHYRSLFHRATRTFSLSEVGLIDVVEDDEGERLYRMELILQSGEKVPLRFTYSIGKRRKRRRAKRVHSAIQNSFGAAYRLEWRPNPRKA
jgi:hypothetical protein